MLDTGVDPAGNGMSRLISDLKRSPQVGSRLEAYPQVGGLRRNPHLGEADAQARGADEIPCRERGGLFERERRTAG